MSRPSCPPSEEEIWKATRAAVAALAENGLNCYIFGSAACAIYGMKNRYPKDVDLVVLTDVHEQEELKNMLVETDKDFYLVPSKDPHATFEVLWYSLPERRPGINHACKVDILIPGIMSLPHIPLEEIVFTPPADDIPLMPYIPLLLMKLKGWIDHGADPRLHVRDKLRQDERDVFELLKLAVEDFGVHLRTEEWIPKDFLEEFNGYIRQYIPEHPDTVPYWEALGFPIA
ncbi:hypothetical protein BDQ17DRAFT_1237020 [Cyathus striatus]|nr:hypothetical protein BDQ17DRAFT_1237020 [Cyathus striatus]